MRPALLRNSVLIAAICAASGCAAPGLAPKLHDATGIGYTLAGAGLPVVVLQSGLGDDSRPWTAVARKLTASHTVFSYDRPGYGDSPAVDGPRDPCRIAAELHGLLHRAHVAPPYLLVGHSIGGLYQFAFASLYPDEVAGLVLLDPTHPEHWPRMRRQAPQAANTLRLLRSTVFNSTERREFDDQNKCVEQLATPLRRSRPARLLVRDQFGITEQGSFESMVHTLETDWQRLTGARQIERIKGSGHYIQTERPEAVIAAIESATAEMRDNP